MSNHGGVNISGSIGDIGGDIIGGNKVTINIINPIGRTIEGDIPPGPNVHFDRKRQFTISWPKDSDWIPSSSMGAYQLAELGVTASSGFRLFGLFEMETQATFAVFKLQRPQGRCVGWVVVDIFKATYGTTASVIAGLVAAFTLKSVRDSGAEIISQDIAVWDGQSWRPSQAPSPEMIYRPQKTDDHCTKVRIIRGKNYVYSLSSPIYPATPAYDNLRQETNAILNSFKVL